MARERLRSCVFATDEGAIYALGMNALYRCLNGAWTVLPLPSTIDARRARGIATRQRGELVVFGEAGLAAVFRPSEAPRALPGTDGDYNWLAAFTEDGDCVLAGERRSRSVGALVEVGNQGFHVHTLQGTTRLHAATRLASGTLLGCGAHGDLVQVLPDSHREVPWGKTGHLFSVVRNNTGGAFAVGSGGHALAVSTKTAIGSTISSDLLATLEAVQTTQDLVSVKLEPDGTAWAVGHNGRLLERRGGVWTRIPIDATGANLIGLQSMPRRVTVVAEDGTVLEGRFD